MNKPGKEADLIWEEISSKIRYLRRKNKLSVEALAKKAGFTKSYLSQIENLKREPTIGALTKIARALGVDFFFLVNGEECIEEEESLVVVKRKDRRTLTSPSRLANTIYESINQKKKDRLMDAYIVTTGFEFTAEPMAHEGEELIFIIEGKQEFVYNGKSQILEEGDCCYFDSSKIHYAKSLGEKMSKALIVFTMRS
jgi:transcriptional regulator with XRE-family HTH domain